MFETSNIEKRVSKPRSKDKEFHRPCKDCSHFRWLSARFGVCESHEHPSEQKCCDNFRRKIA